MPTLFCEAEGHIKAERGKESLKPSIFWASRHICGKTRKVGWFKIRRQTVKKRLRSKLQAVRQELRKRWHERIAETGDWLHSVVRGYFNYHAIPGISERSRRFDGKWRARGWGRSGDAVNGIAFRGSDSARSWIATYGCREFCIRNLECALMPDTPGRSRIR